MPHGKKAASKTQWTLADGCRATWISTASTGNQRCTPIRPHAQMPRVQDAIKLDSDWKGRSNPLLLSLASLEIQERGPMRLAPPAGTARHLADRPRASTHVAAPGTRSRPISISAERSGSSPGRCLRRRWPPSCPKRVISGPGATSPARPNACATAVQDLAKRNVWEAFALSDAAVGLPEFIELVRRPDCDWLRAEMRPPALAALGPSAG